MVEQSSSRLVELPRAGALILGRGDDAELRLDDASISRRHARISLDEAGPRVVDLGSRNGLRLNGAALTQESALAAGDVLSVGEVTLIVRGPAAAQRAQVGPRPAEAPVLTLTLDDRRVVLADSSKGGAALLVSFAALKDVEVLVTDSGLQEADRHQLVNAGLEVVVA